MLFLCSNALLIEKIQSLENNGTTSDNLEPISDPLFEYLDILRTLAFCREVNELNRSKVLDAYNRVRDEFEMLQ